ncbi:DoxX family protein [Allomesorhizobium camelthorni]|uniref:DoxX family protein n=1 Tax=Allomesorhizobium camelthorni TaxID=475069 RepID=A0A6G4WGQ5_9HYPH|nr:DoxX family protein [Mesorhizobium camelthorni]NGO53941.1 DoxX family protein [Mesorhizobium camelthorni]
MIIISKEARAATYARPIFTSPPLRLFALVALCSVYIQRPFMKIYDFDGAIAEMNHFGLNPAPLFAAGIIVFELLMSALILLGIFRWADALCLAGFTLMATFLAFHFWELPPGMERMMATNGFFEHLGLAGAFVLVAWHDLRERAVSGKVGAL